MSQLVRLEGKHSTQNAHCAMAFENSRQTFNSKAVCTFRHPTFCLWKSVAVKLLVLPSKMSPIPYLIKIIFVCKSQDLKWSDSWVDLERSLPFLTWKQECAKGARGDKRSYFVCKRRLCPNFFARKRQLLVLFRNAQAIAVVSFHPKLNPSGTLSPSSDFQTGLLLYWRLFIRSPFRRVPQFDGASPCLIDVHGLLWRGYYY